MMPWNRRLHGSVPPTPKKPPQDPWEDPAMASIIDGMDNMYKDLIMWSHSYIELLEKRIQNLKEQCEGCEHKRNCCDDQVAD